MDTTMTSTVTAITPSDVDQAVAVIVLAFSADPAARWTYPDPHQYLTHFPAIVRAFGGKAFAHGTGYHVSRFAGAALWLPPGIHPDEGHLGRLLQHTLLQCDRDHAPAYLESTNPANLRLYERHGFEMLDTIQVGSSPPIFPMLRAAH